MADKKVKINLAKPATFGGENFAAGVVEVPEAAAAAAVKKGLGEYTDRSSAENSEDILSIEETQKRFSEGDLSDQVVASLRHHKEVLFANENASVSEQKTANTDKSSGKPSTEDPKNSASGDDGNGKTKENTPAESKLPEDFPMRHIFEKSNKLAPDGFKTVAEVQSKTRQELIDLDGIAEKSADAALAYGK